MKDTAGEAKRVPKSSAGMSRRRTPTVRLDSKTWDWYFDGKKRKVDAAGAVIACISDLEHCMASDLANAMRKAKGDYDVEVLVTEIDEAYYDPEEVIATAVSFVMPDDRLMLEIGFAVDSFEDEDEQARQNATILEPLLRRHRMELRGSELHSGAVNPPWPWLARIDVSTRGKTLEDLYDIGLEAFALLDAAQTGELTRTTTAYLIRGGRPHVLIGQPEGHWLDVKSQHYDLTTEHGKISLAQAVTRFCNSEDGGLVVVGMQTKRVPGGEVIRRLSPVPTDSGMVRRYQSVIEQVVYPPPDFLSIESIAVDGGMLVLIDIPPQPEELKPFLVHGAVVDGRVEGAFFSIVRRRGEGSIPITAPMVHSTLAAGRALLRRGELPGETK